MKLGAEKWVDFCESSNVIEDVKSATDGLGAKAAIITAADVRLLPSGTTGACFYERSTPLDPTVQSSRHVSGLRWDTGLSRNAWRRSDNQRATRTSNCQGFIVLLEQ